MTIGETIAWLLDELFVEIPRALVDAFFNALAALSRLGGNEPITKGHNAAGDPPAEWM